MNLTHQYLMNIPKSNWEDLTRVKKLDNSSYNSLINEGIRKVVKDKLEMISQQQKKRNTLSDMVGF